MKGGFSTFLAGLNTGDVLALTAGAVSVLGFAPFGLYLFPILSLALLFAVWWESSPRRAFWRGWLYGVGMFGSGASWLHISIEEFGHAGLLVAIVLTLLFLAALSLIPALVGWLVNRWLRGNPALTLLAVYPAGWVAGEWLRGTILQGFPWLQAGYSQIESPLSVVAPVAGVYGVSLLVAIMGGLLVNAVRLQGTPRWIVAASVIGILISLNLLRDIAWTRTAGDKLQVTLLQGNIPQALKWSPAQRQFTLDLYRRMTTEHTDSDLVIWPETAIPLFYDLLEDDFLESLRAEVLSTDTDLLVGVPVMDKAGRYFNAMTVIGEATPGRFYFKRHLVPFGEFFPWRGLFGPLYEAIVGQRADFSAGEVDQPLLIAAGQPVGISICYEDAFGTEVLDTLPAATMLVNVSNDAWFGDSLAPHQHLEMARMRALETGRYMLRATNTGISAIVSPFGELIAVSPRGRVYAVTAEVQPMQGSTPYIRIGDRWLWVLLPLALTGLPGRRREAANPSVSGRG